MCRECLPGAHARPGFGRDSRGFDILAMAQTFVMFNVRIKTLDRDLRASKAQDGNGLDLDGRGRKERLQLHLEVSRIGANGVGRTTIIHPAQETTASRNQEGGDFV